LLINNGKIKGPELFWWFSKYWPLLLIFWGIVKIADYLRARRRNEPTPGIGAGGVVLVVFLVLFGVAATSASRWDWGCIDPDSSDEWSDGLGFFGTRYDFTASFAQPMISGTQVRIISPRGNITITPSPDDQAHVLVHKYTRSQSQAEANQFDSATHPAFQQQGNLWLLDMDRDAYQHGRFNMEVQVPPRYSVSVMDRCGNIHISQMQGDVDVDTNRGRITAEQIKGNAILHLHHWGNVTATNVIGNLTVDGDVGDSNVTDVTGTLTFTGSYTGNIALSRIGNQVRFKSIRTDLQLAKLDGDLSMNRWNFRGDRLAGPIVLDTETKNIRLEEVSGSVSIKDDRGDIDLRAKAPLGDVDLFANRGQVSISLPEKAGFQIDAESDNGKILSDYSLNINNERHNATANGTVGDGKIQVKLRTNRGTIQIHKD
jgi:hypothetical protein